MDPKKAEEHGNTEKEEGTVALEKKRSRRVSFAEMTSVHIFDRDEEDDTPPDSNDPMWLGYSSDELGLLHLHQDSSDANNSKDSSRNEEEDTDNDDAVLDSRRGFLRPMESPSPGSTIGSATSDDEDNFFGPVSASFIRPGRLSDSAASDENHDITMDSTVFSMHFRSLARSDSGGDMKTPTGVHLSFEEKTPTHANPGSAMVLTVAKRQISECATAIAKLSSGGDSNDMSLVGENPHRYEYGRLSPELDALLAEGSKDFQYVSTYDHIGALMSPGNIESKAFTLKEHQSDSMDASDGGDKGTRRIDTHYNMLTKAASAVHNKLGEQNGDSEISLISQTACDLSSNTSNAPAFDAVAYHHKCSPNQLTKGMPIGTSKEYLSPKRHDLDFSAVSCGALSKMGDKGHPLEGFTHHDCDSPLAEFLSSISAKREKALSNSASPTKFSSIVTPSKKQIGSFVNNVNLRYNESALSIQKSISKLSMLEASPFFSSVLSDKFFDSKLRSLDYLSKTPPFDTALKKNSKDPQVKCVDASVTRSQDQLSSVAQNKGEKERLINMEGNGTETPRKVVDASHFEESTGLVKSGKSLCRKSAGIFNVDQSVEHMAIATLPSQFWSGKQTLQNLLMSEDPAEGTLVTSGTDTSLAEITFDYVGDEKPIGTPRKFVSSPEKRMEKKSLTSAKYQDSLSTDLRLHYRCDELRKFGPVQDVALRGSVITTAAIKLDSLHMDPRAQSSLPILESSHSKNLSDVEMIDDREIIHCDLRDESKSFGNFKSPLRDRDFQNFQSKIPYGNVQTERDSPQFKNDLPGGGTDDASRGSASPAAHRSENEPPFQKNLVKWFTQRTSRKELHKLMHYDNKHFFILEDVLSPKSNQLTTEFENSPARKRRNEAIICRDIDHMDEILRTQRSPKLHKGGGCDSKFLELPDKSNSGLSRMDDELKYWADIYSKFSGDTKQLLSLSVEKLSLLAIDELEDILVNLQRLKQYEMLCTEIQSQKPFDHLGNLQCRRVAETRLLLHRLLHEQTQLQLMHVKRERLMEKARLLTSRIQESQMLKLNPLPQLSVPCAIDAHVDAVACDKLTAMGQVLEILDKKILNLTKSFHNSCKMKGEASCADDIALVKDHLVKRTCCRFIWLDVQLWVVENLESRNGHHSVILNYLGFIIQRLTVNINPVSSIVISTKLNDINIMKKFPNMDACSGFAFVLNAETSRKYIGPRSLAQEIQITSSLLGNLLDVVEEIQLAQIELQNLTKICFHSPSVEQLDLQLCFFDFKRGRKVMLTLDMSCLNWGIYPTEILPSQLAAPADGTHLLSQQLVADIRAAVQSLRAGHLRIIRLCRCVSQVLQTSRG